MKKVKSKSIIACLLWFPAIVGCTTNTPKDLVIKDLSLVEVVSETNKEIDYGRYLTQDNKIYRLKLDFVSNSDIWKIANENNYVLNINSYFCDTPEINVLLSSSGLYWNDVNIGEASIEFSSKILESDVSDIEYSVYLGLYSPVVYSWKEKSDGTKEVEFDSFDLVREPNDVCLLIEGRKMFSRFESNIIKVDRSLIKAKVTGLTSSSIQQ